MSKICEFCGKEFSNISVHQRFCKAKKEALEKSDKFSNKLSIEEAKNLVTETNIGPAKGTNGSVIPKENLVSENKEPTDEQVEQVEEAMKNIQDVEKDQQVDTSTTEEKDTQLAPEFKQEMVVEFNEDRDSWQEKLIDIFKSVKSGSIVNIKLKSNLSHEFSEHFGIYKYPSDTFIQILRDNCESWEDKANEIGGQTYTCIIK